MESRGKELFSRSRARSSLDRDFLLLCLFRNGHDIGSVTMGPATVRKANKVQFTMTDIPVSNQHN